MNKRILLTLTFALMTVSSIFAHDYSVKIDKDGNFRRSDNNEIMSFYGVNYTLPFAHAYRAINYIGKNHKEAIDRDVYHIARLGMNAYRIHIWDVEISDSKGNLIANEHLDLLDYLIAELEKRDIHVILTAQTNFGNGYPEKNIDTGGYSYDYEKCKMHDIESCIKAQENFAKGLAKHYNKYNGTTYSSDNSIIALEINNEPCHSGTAKAAKNYINRMVKAFRKAGFKKPLLYNVSHNMDVHTQAFFDSDIQGTTYQWYPTGLVAGHERKGNFLPNVDSYDIPFSNVKNFDKMAKVIYEFDPGDVLCSYLYPAVARTFRSAGFQWITQFAYDPIDIAWANTEYQTHYLNLAYTPGKAIGMKIAAEVVKNVKSGTKFPKYPQDTIFGDFRVSYIQNLSEYNGGDKFFYSNSTSTQPRGFNNLTEIAGVGSSPIVKYSGTGAYFIDKIGKNQWRLEVLPDVFMIADPFEKPSLKRKVAEIIYGTHSINLNLPELNKNYYYKGINDGNNREGIAVDGRFDVTPGVYILGNDIETIANVKPLDQFKNMKIGEYVAPEKNNVKNFVLHTPMRSVERKDGKLTIRATVAGSYKPDSVVVYPKNISFWNEHNTLYKMQCDGDYSYSVDMPLLGYNDMVEYNIVVFENGESTTYPQSVEGTPLSWDFNSYKYYYTPIRDAEDKIVLLDADDVQDIEVATIPDYSKFRIEKTQNEPEAVNCITLSMESSNDGTQLFLRKVIADIIRDAKSVDDKTTLSVKLLDAEGVDTLNVALLSNQGITYRKSLVVDNNNKIIKLPLAKLQQDKTALIPAPFPVFLSRWFETEVRIPFSVAEVEQIEISTPACQKGDRLSLRIAGMWLE